MFEVVKFWLFFFHRFGLGFCLFVFRGFFNFFHLWVFVGWLVFNLNILASRQHMKGRSIKKFNTILIHITMSLKTKKVFLSRHARINGKQMSSYIPSFFRRTQLLSSLLCKPIGNYLELDINIAIKIIARLKYFKMAFKWICFPFGQLSEAFKTCCDILNQMGLSANKLHS